MLLTSTEPSLSSRACATVDAGGFLTFVHVPAVKGSWAIAMLHQASANRAIPSVRNTFIVVDLASFFIQTRLRMRTSIDLPQRKESPRQSNSQSPKSRDYTLQRFAGEQLSLKNYKLILGRAEMSQEIADSNARISENRKLSSRTWAERLQVERLFPAVVRFCAVTLRPPMFQFAQDDLRHELQVLAIRAERDSVQARWNFSSRSSA